MTLTPEQLEMRKHGIGASEIAAIMGLDKYRTAVDVFLEKTSQVEPFEGNEATFWGNRLEAVIADEYAERMKVEIVESGTLVHPKYEWAMATPDRIVVVDEKWGLECKNRGAYNVYDWGETGSDQVPDEVAAQCQWGMEVSGLRRWDAAVLLGGNRLGIYTLEYDHELAELMLEAAHEFWQNNVLKGIVPALDGSESSVNYLNRKWSTHGGLILTATPEISETAEELRQIRAEIKEKETENTRLENLLKDVIGEAAGIELPDGKSITWKRPKSREKVDWKAIAEALADVVPADEFEKMVKQHTETIEVARTFRVPRNW